MRLILALAVTCCVALAAPIPKSLKKQSFDISGMWKLVEHNSNGRPGSVEGMIRYWKFTDESFEYYKDEITRHGNEPTKLKTPDPDKPQVKIMHDVNPCYFERDGNRMVWVYGHTHVKLDNCEPGPDRYQYVFELVK
jgi:hypothetical protein